MSGGVVDEGAVANQKGGPHRKRWHIRDTSVSVVERSTVDPVIVDELRV